MQVTNNTADQQSNASLPQRSSAFKIQDQLDANSSILDHGITPRVADLIHSSTIMSSNKKLNEPKFDINHALYKLKKLPSASHIGNTESASLTTK